MQHLEDFRDAQIQSSLKLEAYEAKWKWKEQEPVAELEIILIDSDSSERSATGNDNVIPVSPQDRKNELTTHKISSQGELATETAHEPHSNAD